MAMKLVETPAIEVTGCEIEKHERREGLEVWKYKKADFKKVTPRFLVNSLFEIDVQTSKACLKHSHWSIFQMVAPTQVNTISMLSGI